MRPPHPYHTLPGTRARPQLLVDNFFTRQKYSCLSTCGGPEVAKINKNKKGVYNSWPILPGTYEVCYSRHIHDLNNRYRLRLSGYGREADRWFRHEDVPRLS